MLKPELFRSWNASQIVDWAMTLENGRLEQYREALQSVLAKQKINGGMFGTKAVSTALEKVGMVGADYFLVCRHIFELVLWERAQRKASKDSLFSKMLDRMSGIDVANVRRVLVAAVAIAEYFPSTDYGDLPGVLDDVEKYNKTLRFQFDYAFVSNRGTAMTFSELSAFLEKVRRQLIAGAFEGLILCVSSHGDSKGIVCSDGLTMSVEEIKAMFTLDALLGIPRVLIADACRSSFAADDDVDEKKQRDVMAGAFVLSADAKADKLSVVLRPTSEGREVTGGMLAEHVTRVLSENMEQPLALGDVLAEVSRKIEAASNGEQVLIAECSEQARKVTFRPNDAKRGRKKRKHKGGDDQISMFDRFLEESTAQQFEQRMGMSKKAFNELVVGKKEELVRQKGF